MSRVSNALGRRGSLARLGRDSRGQGTVELALIVPVILVLLLGLIEVARAFDVVHELKGLAREGANLASRGTHPDSVMNVLLFNGADLQLDSRGGTVVSMVQMESGAPVVKTQVSSPGVLGRSYLGAPADTVRVLGGAVFLDGQTVHVVELFYDFIPVTPLRRLLGPIVPDTLYQRTVF